LRVENVSASSRTRGGVVKIGTHVPEPAHASVDRHAKGGAPKVTRVSESFPASKSSSKPVKSVAVHPTQPAKKSAKKKQ
jgi:membrane-bound lytic murein transglycosylase D